MSNCLLKYKGHNFHSLDFKFIDLNISKKKEHSKEKSININMSIGKFIK